MKSVELYGLKIIMALDGTSDRKMKTLQEVAEQSGIGRDYIEQITRKLRKAGLVKSRRGVGGGIWLAKPANQIEVYDLLMICDRSIPNANDPVAIMMRRIENAEFKDITVENIINRLKRQEEIDQIKLLNQKIEREYLHGSAVGGRAQ